MKEKTVKILMIAFIFIMFVCTQTVYGYSCDIELTPDKTEIKQGETVELEIELKDIDATDGVASFEAMLVYDDDEENEDTFEFEIETESKWTCDVIGNTLTITEKDYEGATTDQVIGKIKLTAKSDISIGTHTIALTKINCSTGGTYPESFEIDNKQVEINVIKNDGSSEKDPNEDENPDPAENNDKEKEEDKQDEGKAADSETETQPGTYEPGKASQKQVGNTSPSIIPALGAWGIIRFILLILLIGVSIFFYKKSNKWKNI